MADVSVRPARGADAPALAAVQVATWRTGYAGLLPGSALDALASQEDAFAEQWRTAALSPPSPRHRVLVGCDGPVVVAGAALGPAEDDDQDPMTSGELYTFVVDPEHRREGHGSRLLSAAVDFLRGDGFSTVGVWLDAADDAARGLFTAAGWAADGSHRRLDFEGDGSVVVQQVRLHTDLAEEAGP
jgi:ribosomal protein S18 acetylase RimI-like enzyme